MKTVFTSDEPPHLWTREDYMQKRVSHHDYYAQFVTPEIISLVRLGIGEARLRASSDQYFNDIPLVKWDSLHVRNVPGGMISSIASGEKIKLAGDGNSASTGTCILKTAARIILGRPKLAPITKDSMKVFRFETRKDDSGMGWIYKGDVSADGSTTFGQLLPTDRISWDFPTESDEECEKMETVESSGLMTNNNLS